MSTTVVVATIAAQESGRPIADAELSIPALGRRATTDLLGQATLRDVPPGEHTFEVRAMGYAMVRASLQVRGDTIGPVFFLSRSPVTLDTVQVASTRPSWHLAEFERRRAMGIGQFLDAKDLEKERGRMLPLVLSDRLAGVRAYADLERRGRYVLRSIRPATAVDTPNAGKEARRTAPSHQNSGGAAMARAVVSPQAKCAVDVYLDGHRYPGTVDEITISEIAGVELYPTAAAPPEYRRGTGACHILLLWSKR